MKGTEYRTKKDVLRRAQEAVGLTIGQIDKTGRLSTGKGAIGTVVEESWFGYVPNSNADPDFTEAGVELKVTPYIRTNKDVRAKERLVLTIINYMTEYQKTFKTSDFWHKSEVILIMSYGYKENVPKKDFTIDSSVLFSFPDEDLVIIKQDWEKIITRIKAGEAHLITEGDTLYLAACPKGASSKSKRIQPYSSILAMQRAYSLKTTYMTKVFRSYIFGEEKDEHIVKDWHNLEHKSFEQYILDKLSLYYGKTQKQLRSEFGMVKTTAKNINELLLAKMLDVEGKIADTTEFRYAGIVPKTIRVMKNGHIKESMSFPTFKFKNIVKETWETSEFRNYLEPTKFLFVIFRENEIGELVFERGMFWNMPAEDLKEVRRVWERTVTIIKDGVKLYSSGGVMKNNLPKQTESPIAHVRPHARNAEDTYPLPDGREMVKQCFWLNRNYVEKIIELN